MRKSFFVNGALRKNMSCNVKKGDKILVKFKKILSLIRISFAFHLLNHAAESAIRQFISDRFFGGGVNPPEFDWDFSTVFQNSDGTQLFWKNCRGADLRIIWILFFFTVSGFML